MLAATIRRAHARDHEDGRLVHVIREVLRRRHDPCLLGIAPGVVKGEVASGNGERDIDGPPLAIHVSERTAFGRISDDDKVPVRRVGRAVTRPGPSPDPD